MSENKKLIPSFGCREGQAVILDHGGECYGGDYIALSRYYSDNGADGIVVRDLSETEEDHERTIQIMKEIARNVDIPLIVGGHIKRLEDVKKYLYTGAKHVFLNVSVDENVDMMKEAADRFGNEKIYAYLPDCSYLERAEEYAQLGASKMILGCVPTPEELSRIGLVKQSMYLSCWEDDLETLSSYLNIPFVDGVILTVPVEKGESCMEMKQKLHLEGIPVMILESSIPWTAFKQNSDGLVPVVVQDYKTLEVLMLAYMNEEAYKKTLETGKMTYFSRSREKLWLKGETSGHFQYVKSLSLDCDNDTVLAKVAQVGVACHTGAKSCFFQNLAEQEYRDVNPLKVFEEVYGVIKDRKQNPKEGSYTNYLFDKGLDKILKKMGEEATEIVIAAKNPNPEEIKYEISDFLYHMMVLMAEKKISWEDITEELANR